jgi:hypothetical protein
MFASSFGYPSFSGIWWNLIHFSFTSRGGTLASSLLAAFQGSGFQAMQS